jgi:putative nucleotidyltransferase with HDIG domain
MITDAKTFLQGYVELYSLPTTFYRIHSAIDDPHVSVEDLSRIISEDSGMTLRLLRLVNSSFYSFPSKIDTVSRAIAIIGTSQLHDLVLGTSIISMFKDIPPELADMESFWKHSIACGVASRTIARYKYEPNIERLFIAGLLHDIGRLIIFIRRPRVIAEILKKSLSSGELVVRGERAEFGFDHADVGFELMQKWGLPRVLQEPIRYHHRPAEAREFALETSIVHVADVIAHTLLIGSSGETRIPPLDENAWKMVGLKPDHLDAMLEKMDTQISAAFQAIVD